MKCKKAPVNHIVVNWSFKFNTFTQILMSLIIPLHPIIFYDKLRIQDVTYSTKVWWTVGLPICSVSDTPSDAIAKAQENSRPGTRNTLGRLLL